MRVITGSAKGRQLRAAGDATRPITDRVKTSLFNILSTRVVNANVLDLFAGAGSVGIEALSRGARHATFVELDQAALRAIRENLQTTRLAERATVVRQDVFKFIRLSAGAPGAREKYDLIYVAPPQYKGLWGKTLEALEGQDLLAENGTIVAQIHPKEYRDLPLEKFELVDQRKYGSTMLCFYESKTSGPAREE